MSSKVPKKKQNKKPLVSENIEEKIITDELQANELIKDDDQPHSGSKSLRDEPEEEDDQPIEEIKTKDKKPRTEKQLEQLKKAREKALINKEIKRKEKEQEQEKIKKILDETKQEQKKALEQKVVKKALSIKKKEIKKQQALDDISDDETPIEKVKIPQRKAETTPQKKNIIYFD